MKGRRLAALAIAAGLWNAAGLAPAAADPAGPSDYETTVVAVEPAIDDVAVDVIGGDAFVRLTSTSDVVVDVIGYRGEPYLRFLPGGIVEQNDRSPSAYLNEDRYAAVDLPASASADAAPEWRQVASDGSYAWHDHRAHWMNDVPPPGRGPGDQILEGVIPLIVDGVEVDVTVASVWQPAPPVTPAVAGALLGLGLAAAAFAGRRRNAIDTAIALLASLALVTGLVAFFSVPGETAPSWTLWVLPATSLLLAALARLGRRPGRAGGTWMGMATLIAAFELVAWGVMRWDWMWRALLPTSMPPWVDRSVTSAALVGGAGLAAAAVHRIVAVDVSPR